METKLFRTIVVFGAALASPAALGCSSAGVAPPAGNDASDPSPQDDAGQDATDANDDAAKAPCVVGVDGGAPLCVGAKETPWVQCHTVLDDAGAIADCVVVDGGWPTTK